MTDLATARAECCRKIAEKLETNPILWTERREQAGVGQISNRGMWSAFNMHHPVEPRDFFTDAAAADDLVEAAVAHPDIGDYEHGILQNPGIDYPHSVTLALTMERDRKEVWKFVYGDAQTRPEAVTLAVAAWLGIDTTGCLT